jgi:predicted hydrocarbon binding protein
VSTLIDQAESLRFALSASCEFGWPATNPRAMNRFAESFGHEMAKSTRATNLREAFNALAVFWEENDLGRLAFRLGKQNLIKMTQCYDCAEWRYGFTSVPCTFKSTLLRVALEDMLNEDVKVAEVECCRTGGQGCTFAVTGVDKA